MSKVKHSSGDDKPDYLKVSFWENPTNHFWENGYWSESAKQYYRDWIANMRQNERRLTNLKAA